MRTRPNQFQNQCLSDNLVNKQPIRLNVEKLKEGFQKFHYEAEFVKETKQDDKK